MFSDPICGLSRFILGVGEEEVMGWIACPQIHMSECSPPGPQSVA